jgi:glycerate kinase
MAAEEDTSIAVRVLIAFDKFKGSISAVAAVGIFAQALQEASPELHVNELPISDGGGGALDILTSYGFQEKSINNLDALLQPKISTYGLAESGQTAFIEMANLCGIADLPHLDGFGASSFGVGEAAIDAIERGAKHIIISLGGSASTDGGLGFLQAIGAEANDADGNSVSPNLTGLGVIADINIDYLPKDVTWTFLTDVENPLVGMNGAAHVYGEQKGLGQEDRVVADSLLNSWADLLHQKSGKEIRNVAGTGAAGGVAAVGLSLLNGRIESGAQWLAQLFGVEKKIMESDLVVTGEGYFDKQSLMGKGPGLVIELARKHQKEIFVIAGKVDSEVAISESLPFISLIDIAPSLEDAMSQPGQWLRTAAKDLAIILNV